MPRKRIIRARRNNFTSLTAIRPDAIAHDRTFRLARQLDHELPLGGVPDLQHWSDRAELIGCLDRVHEILDAGVRQIIRAGKQNLNSSRFVFPDQSLPITGLRDTRLNDHWLWNSTTDMIWRTRSRFTRYWRRDPICRIIGRSGETHSFQGATAILEIQFLQTSPIFTGAERVCADGPRELRRIGNCF